MKRFSEQLHKKSQTVKLKKAEQADLRERIVSYMEYHPLPAEMKAATAPTKSPTRQSLPLEAFATYKLPFAQMFKFGGACAAIVLVVIPFVAERAVPGDTLYAVKVNINEEVRSTLTLDPYEKVEWEAVRLNRRIAEARLLADAGLLTPAAEAEVAQAVKMHTANAKAEIELMRLSDADDAAIAELSLDSTLTVQAHALAGSVLSADVNATTSARTDLIATAIGESLEKPAGHATATLPALPKLVARVEQGTTRLRELEASLGTEIDSITTVDVTRRIEDIERAAAEGFALTQEAETQAQEILFDVLRRTQKLIVFMTELQVRESVAIETVVPVVLTLDERNVNRATRITQIDTYLNRLNATELADAALAEKLAEIIDRLQSVRTEINATEDYVAFMILSSEGLALGKDATLLVEQSGAQVVVPPLVDDVATSTDAITDTASSSATTTDAVADVEPEVGAVAEIEDVNQVQDVVIPEPSATTTVDAAPATTSASSTESQ